MRRMCWGWGKTTNWMLSQPSSPRVTGREGEKTESNEIIPQKLQHNGWHRNLTKSLQNWLHKIPSLADCWFSCCLYWYEAAYKDTDFDQLQRGSISRHAKLFCWKKGKAQMQQELIDMTTCELGPLLCLYQCMFTTVLKFALNSNRQWNLKSVNCFLQYI